MSARARVFLSRRLRDGVSLLIPPFTNALISPYPGRDLNNERGADRSLSDGLDAPMEHGTLLQSCADCIQRQHQSQRIVEQP